MFNSLGQFYVQVRTNTIFRHVSKLPSISRRVHHLKGSPTESKNIPIDKTGPWKREKTYA